MIFKIVYGKEIHVLNRQVSFDELMAFVRSAFKKLPQNFTLSYIDAEGDTIALTGSSDMDILYINHSKASAFKIMIDETVEELPRADNSADDFDYLEEKKPAPVEPKVEEKVPEPVDIASLIASRLNEIIP